MNTQLGLESSDIRLIFAGGASSSCKIFNTPEDMLAAMLVRASTLERMSVNAVKRLLMSQTPTVGRVLMCSRNASRADSVSSSVWILPTCARMQSVMSQTTYYCWQMCKGGTPWLILNSVWMSTPDFKANLCTPSSSALCPRTVNTIDKQSLLAPMNR